MESLTIAVVGAGSDEQAQPLLSTAETVGDELARAGATLICGGLAGVMTAAAKGARHAGGTTIGVLPGADRSAANPYIDIAIPSGLGEARNTLIVRAADAVIAIGGGYGTLSEIGFALKIGRPVVGILTWELYREGRPDDGIQVVEDPREAVATAIALAQRYAGGSGLS